MRNLYALYAKFLLYVKAIFIEYLHLSAENRQKKVTNKTEKKNFALDSNFLLKFHKIL